MRPTRDPIAAEAQRLEQRGDFGGARAVWRKKLNGNAIPYPAGHGEMDARMIHLRIARLAVLNKDWTAALQCYLGILEHNPLDFRARRGLEATLVRAARDAESAGRWRDACDRWLELAKHNRRHAKIARNMAFCCRVGASEAEARNDSDAQLKFWQDYLAIDAKSSSGRREFQRCLVQLARDAEHGGYITRARRYWGAMLKEFPGDIRAVKGLQRTGGRVESY